MALKGYSDNEAVRSRGQDPVSTPSFFIYQSHPHTHPPSSHNDECLPVPGTGDPRRRTPNLRFLIF